MNWVERVKLIKQMQAIIDTNYTHFFYYQINSFIYMPTHYFSIFLWEWSAWCLLLRLVSITIPRKDISILFRFSICIALSCDKYYMKQSCHNRRQNRKFIFLIVIHFYFKIIHVLCQQFSCHIPAFSFHFWFLHSK